MEKKRDRHNLLVSIPLIFGGNATAFAVSGDTDNTATGGSGNIGGNGGAGTPSGANGGNVTITESTYLYHLR